jgi:hypothetical protein
MKQSVRRLESYLERNLGFCFVSSDSLSSKNWSENDQKYGKCFQEKWMDEFQSNPCEESSFLRTSPDLQQ